MIERYALMGGGRRNLCDAHAEAHAAELKQSVGQVTDALCDDCQEIAARPERRLLAEAVKAVDDFVGDLDDTPNPFLDTGCNGCTEGNTPTRFDRGPCWLHAAKKLLTGAVLTDEQRKIELHAAVFASVIALADDEAGERVAFIDAAALTAKINERLDALVDSRLI